MIAVCILFFGLVTIVWAMSRPVKCGACGERVYVAHLECPKGGKSFLVR